MTERAGRRSAERSLARDPAEAERPSLRARLCSGTNQKSELLRGGAILVSSHPVRSSLASLGSALPPPSPRVSSAAAGFDSKQSQPRQGAPPSAQGAWIPPSCGWQAADSPYIVARDVFPNELGVAPPALPCPSAPVSLRFKASASRQQQPSNPNTLPTLPFNQTLPPPPPLLPAPLLPAPPRPPFPEVHAEASYLSQPSIARRPLPVVASERRFRPTGGS